MSTASTCPSFDVVADVHRDVHDERISARGELREPVLVEGELPDDLQHLADFRPAATARVWMPASSAVCADASRTMVPGSGKTGGFSPAASTSSGWQSGQTDAGYPCSRQ